MQLVTLKIFNSPAEAQLAANLLEAEEIPCFLTNQEVMANLWHIGPAIGGVKLQVDAESAERGSAILTEGQPKTSETEQTSAVTMKHRLSATPHQQLVRAWKSAMIGIVLFPITFYSFWLLGEVFGKFAELTSKDQILCLGTVSVNLVVLCLTMSLFVFL